MTTQHDAMQVSVEQSSERIYHWTFVVHLWTLTGLAFAVFALRATVDGNFDTAARLLIGALLVDFTDGTLARLLRVRQRMPLISGEVIVHHDDNAATLDWRFDAPAWTRAWGLLTTATLDDDAVTHIELKPMPPK